MTHWSASSWSLLYFRLWQVPTVFGKQLKRKKEKKVRNRANEWATILLCKGIWKTTQGEGAGFEPSSARCPGGPFKPCRRWNAFIEACRLFYCPIIPDLRQPSPPKRIFTSGLEMPSVTIPSNSDRILILVPDTRREGGLVSLKKSYIFYDQSIKSCGKIDGSPNE